jgi:hypothetical protein
MCLRYGSSILAPRSITPLIFYELRGPKNKALLPSRLAAAATVATGGVVQSVTAPAWRLTLSIPEHEIRRCYSGLGVGWSKRYQVRSQALEPLLARIELHRNQGEELQRLSFLASFCPGVEHALHALSLVRADGKELVRIDLLTKGEARWLADVLFKTFPGWFA